MRPIGLKKVLQKVKPGTMIERLVKPVGRAMGLPCYEKDGRLKPESPCAKRRDMLDGVK